MRWISEPAVAPHPSVPLLVGTRETWAAWPGRDATADAVAALDGVVGVAHAGAATWIALPSYDQGDVHLGLDDDAVVLLRWFGSARGLAARKKRIAARADAEYLAGAIDVTDALVLGDAWTRGFGVVAAKQAQKQQRDDGALFVIPLAAGRYVVLEGQDEDGEEAVWIRIERGEPAAHRPRPPKPSSTPSPEEAARRLLFQIEHTRIEGKQLAATNPVDHVKEIVALEQATLLERRIAELSTTRPAYARWLGILLDAVRGGAPEDALRALAEEWLAPATSTRSANQDVSRAELLHAFDLVSPASPLRAQVAEAPAPEPFVEDGDFF